MKKFLLMLVIVIVLLIGTGFYLFYFNQDFLNSLPFIQNLGHVEMKPLALNQEDISNITKPAVVSIYHHIDGKVVVPFFDVDWKTLDIVFPSKEKPIEVPVDEYIRGSGFVVSKDGYVVTNAHVASDVSYRRSFAQQLISLRFLAALKSKKELKQIDATMKVKGVKDVDAEQFGEQLALDLGKKLADKIVLTAEQKLVVLDPSSKETKLSDLIDKGYPAKIVDVNDGYIEDEKDVAIFKVEGASFPAVDLNAGDTLNTGNKIFIYGFPSSGEFNTHDALEPTFTQGTISGLKDSKTKAFQVIQTDAKVSPGSSGGPLFNTKGEVVGVLTFASSADTVGDAFAFAIPISLVKDMLQGKNITLEKSAWAESLKSGILNLQNNKCKDATKDFESAQNSNSISTVSKNVQAYIDICSVMIASGASIDTPLDEIKIKLGNMGGIYWLLAGLGVFIFLIIIFVIFKLMRRIKKDEMEINHLGHPVGLVSNQPQTLHNMPGSVSIGDKIFKPIDIGLLNYVQGANKAGMSKEAIRTNLKKGNWTDEEITEALNALPKA